MSARLSGMRTLMIVFLALLTVGSGGYFIPTLIAYCRQHHNAGMIFFLNLIFGWTVIGWVIALFWACSQVRGALDQRYRYAAA
jgi:hypothetical protein